MARSKYIYVVRDKGTEKLRMLGTVKHEVHTAVAKSGLEIPYCELVRYRDCGCFASGMAMSEVIPWEFDEFDLSP